MIVQVPLNIQMSTSAVVNIEGVLFEVGLNVQRVLPIDLIR
jgi:hypothetical protein